MSEIFLLAGFSKDFNNQDLLRTLVVQLKSQGKTILLVDHKPVPSDIVDLVDFYFYNRFNEIVDDEDYKYFTYYGTGDGWTVWSKNQTPGSTILPVLSNLFLGMTIAKNLNYQICHYIEYDTQIPHADFFQILNLKLKDHDVNVFYRDELREGFTGGKDVEGEENKLMGHMVSFKLSSFSFEEINYNRNRILKEFKKYVPHVEYYLLNTLYKDKKINRIPASFVLDKGVEWDLQKQIVGISNTTIVGCNRDRVWKGLVDNKTDSNVVVEFINESNYLRKVLLPQSFFIEDMGNIEENSYLKIIVNNEIKQELTFTSQEQKEIYIKNNYLKWEN